MTAAGGRYPILVVGSNGQLGRQVRRALELKGIPYAAFARPDIDVGDPASVARCLKSVRPSAVVNCAAYTGVDKAESEPEAAFRVNALGPENLARVCSQSGIELVHISTDYVFGGPPPMENGRARPYVETDPCRPQNAYGRTKLEGERRVAAAGGGYYILRTAWLYGGGRNFVRAILHAAIDRGAVRVADDQTGSPTSAADLANAVLALAGSGAYGLYHAAGRGCCTRCEFARKILGLAGVRAEVIPVPGAEYPLAAVRPSWTPLQNAALERMGLDLFRPWEEALGEYIRAGAPG